MAFLQGNVTSNQAVQPFLKVRHTNVTQIYTAIPQLFKSLPYFCCLLIEFGQCMSPPHLYRGAHQQEAPI